jgi:zinc transport system substrate-binding protein
MDIKKVGIIVGILAVLAGGLYLVSESGTQEVVQDDDGVIDVMVSVLPQVDFVERIGGDKVAVTEMIPPGFSPATYNPSPEQLQKLQNAEIYFRIGHIAFEGAQMDMLANMNPSMKVVDTSVGVPLRTMVEEHSHEDEEGMDEMHEGEDVHEDADVHEEDAHELEEGGDDPHIWLSPKLVKIQAKNILDGLVAHSPENEEYFTENYEKFVADLDLLDARLQEAFAPIAGETILVFHPAFGYLADAYGFTQESIEIEGKEPTPAQLKDIIDRAKEDESKVVFVQAQFSTKSAEAVAKEIGGAVVQIDPLAPDYFTNLESMAQTITDALK